MFDRWCNPQSYLVHFLELIAGGGVVAYFGLQTSWVSWGWSSWLPLILASVMYIINRIFSIIHWHHVPNRRQLVDLPGIERHFSRAIVFVIYALLSGTVLLWLTGRPEFYWIGNLVAGFFTYVGFVLIWFRLRDCDPTPVNFYTARYKVAASNDAVALK